MFRHRAISVVVGLLWGVVVTCALRALVAITGRWFIPWPVYLAVGLVVAALTGLDDWRYADPGLGLPDFTKDRHVLCEECWRGAAKHAPYRVQVQKRTFEKCCGCGQTQRDGIYVRADRRFTCCDH